MSSRIKVTLLAALALAMQSADAFAQFETTDATVYLFSTFKEPEQDGLRFAYSFDGYHWTNVPGLFLKAEVGDKIMRDPSLLRGPDGTFHLVWTSAWHGGNGFGYARSKDLVHWSDQKLIPVMAQETNVVNVWAPELFYDDGSWHSSRGDEAQTKDHKPEPPDVGCYVIVWASTIPGRFPDHLEPHDNNHRMYFTMTRDFESLAPTKLFLDPDFSVIDCQILKDEDRYVLLLKDNTRPQRNIRVAFADTPLGPWRNISTNLTEKFTEGPCGLKINQDWIIYYEAYQAKHYAAMKTRDFKTFTDVTAEMTFPAGLKHGTAFKATRTDLDRLLKAGAEMTAAGPSTK
jgi:hypothetical protein